MNIKKILVLFIVFFIPVFLSAQNTGGSKGKIATLKNKDQSNVLGSNIDAPDLENVNPLNNAGAVIGNNNSVFSITPVDVQNILSADITAKTIPLKSSSRPVPVALYVNNSIKNLDSVSSNPLDLAYAILSNSEVKSQMGIKSEKNFHIVNSVTDELGITHIKMNQYYKGILIFGGQIYVHYKADKTFSLINGRWYKDDRVHTNRSANGYRNPSNISFLLSDNQIKNIITNDLSKDRIKIKRLSQFGDRFKPDRIWTISKMMYFNDHTQSLIPVFVVDIV
ncbi:MAG TPA: hypothetical protein ENK91_09825, partial [Bacteroidetes bacterium]|nr:hypothetical protein [Bacteroidota bacterium]